jgi:hypothetical protein
MWAFAATSLIFYGFWVKESQRNATYWIKREQKKMILTKVKTQHDINAKKEYQKWLKEEKGKYRLFPIISFVDQMIHQKNYLYHKHKSDILY